jgi:Family of unknown function (DUF6221)
VATVTLLDFVNARLDEAEERARALMKMHGGRVTFLPRSPTVRKARANLSYEITGAELLADVEAKRRMIAEVVDDVAQMESRISEEWAAGEPETHDASELLLRLLALPDDNHPDYLEEWRP